MGTKMHFLIFLALFFSVGGVAAEKIEILDSPAQALLVIKFHSSLAGMGMHLKRELPRILAYLQTKGQAPAGQPLVRFFKVDGEKADAEVGLPVATALEGSGKIVPDSIPAGKVAVSSHFGAYEKLPEAHRSLEAWLKKNGKTQAGPAWEVFISDPAQTAPSKVETRISIL